MASATFHAAAQASGLKYSIAALGVVALALDSTSGVSTCQWTVESADDTSVVSDWILSAPTAISGTNLTAPSGSNKACIVRCDVNGGAAMATLGGATARLKVYIGPSEVACVGETTQSNSTYGWTGIVNGAVRTLGGSGTATSAATPNTIASRDGGGGSAFGQVTLTGINSTGSFTLQKNGSVAATVTVNDTGANEIQWGANVSAVTLDQAQRGTNGTGATWTLRAQRGLSGNGGQLIIGGGDPGTAGTHNPGGVQIQLGTPKSVENSGLLTISAGTTGDIRYLWYRADLSVAWEQVNVNTHVAPQGDLSWVDNGLNKMAVVNSAGFAIGGAPQTGQNRCLLISDVFATQAPGSGVFLGSVSGQLKTFAPNGVQQELTTKDSASGATSKRVLTRLGRASTSSATTTTVLTIPAADLPSGDYSARIVVEWGGYDTTPAAGSKKSAGGSLRATIRRDNGTTSVMTTVANQQGTSTDNDTTSIDTTTTKPTIAQSAGAIIVQITTLNTNAVRLWAEARATAIEH